MLTVSIDVETCISTGSCVQVCPDVFELRDDGYVYVKDATPPESLRPEVLEAVELCPVKAIKVEG
jgi:ferredoxin